MLASFKGGTVFVLAGTDGDDDTETAGEGSTFAVGTGVNKSYHRGYWRSRYRV